MIGTWGETYYANQNKSDEEKIIRGGILLRIFVRGVSK